MQSQLHFLARLSSIDNQIDELQEEYGDLPTQVKLYEKKANEQKSMYVETQGILEEIKKFCSNSSKNILELKEKEQELSQKQFKVRNNKEFDAITKQIEFVKQEQVLLADKIRVESLKEENLLRILEDQKNNYEEAEKDFIEKEKELDFIISDQNEELIMFKERRKEILVNITPAFLEAYDRIRGHLKDAVVKIRKNSCSGCFSAVPPQKIVEIRNNLDKIYTCENCGRIIYPEELLID